MKKQVLLLVLTVSSAQARLPEAQAWRYVDAIRVAEGNPNYGVLTVKTRDPRRVCYNTVQNTHDRWIKAGRPGDYLTFLARRYCPPSVDPVGHANWQRNVKLGVDNPRRKP